MATVRFLLTISSVSSTLASNLLQTHLPHGKAMTRAALRVHLKRLRLGRALTKSLRSVARFILPLLPLLWPLFWSLSMTRLL
jgi:hypothetical protein